MTKSTKLGGAFTLGGTSTNLYRMGYGAMQLAGPGLWPQSPNSAQSTKMPWQRVNLRTDFD
jgi:hypothetical protein